MSVSITPGLSGTAAIPFGSSWASASVSPSTAYLLAQYGATSGEVLRPQPLERFTITPLFRATIAGTNARITFATPFTFTSMTASNSAAGTCHSGAGVFISAALFTSRSGGPTFASTAVAHAATAGASRTSTAAKSCGGPNAARSSPTWAPLRPQPTTVWPAAANAGTSDRPRPRVAPVTTITRG